MLDSLFLKATSPTSIAWSHTNAMVLSPSLNSCLLQAPFFYLVFSGAELECLDAKFLPRLSNQPGVRVDTDLDSAVLKVLLLLLDFAHCLATMFETQCLKSKC